MNAILAPGFRAQPYWWDAAAPGPAVHSVPEEAEVAIVGGGFTGLSAALTLRRHGVSAVVLDAERIGWGASSRNGGAVVGGAKLVPPRLERRIGAERAKPIKQAGADSLPFIEALIRDEGIDCDYVRVGRYSAASTRQHFTAMAAQTEALAKPSGDAVWTVPRTRQREELGSDLYHGGMVMAAAGSIHPAKYARGLAQATSRAGAALVDATRVLGIRPEGSGFQLETSKGAMRAAAVLVATNGYSYGERGRSALPWLARRLVPVASYIIATEPMEPARVAALFPHRRVCTETRRVMHYFRPSPDGTRVLWGGRASFRPVTAEHAAPRLHAAMIDALPELRGIRVSHAWTGNVAFTFDGLPHLGQQDGIHYAAGYQGAGVAMASWLGHQAGLKIAGRTNRPFALDGLDFPTVPGYRGHPWFLPLVGGWYRLLDWFDRQRT
jgi:glycine/D-amino acid oxidase-like deaminating enzyme